MACLAQGLPLFLQSGWITNAAFSTRHETTSTGTNTNHHNVSHTFPLSTFPAEPEYDDYNHSCPPKVLQTGAMTAVERARRTENAELANPLAKFSHTMLEEKGREYAQKYKVDDEEDLRAFAIGAVLAQDPSKYETVAGLTEEERKVLHQEDHHRWHQPAALYIVILVCSTCAAVQGLDETVVSVYVKNKFVEIVTVPRNRRAMIASELLMFLQQVSRLLHPDAREQRIGVEAKDRQFCGVNIIAYYSSQIFLDGGFSQISALSASLGFGLINFVFAIPAIYTIDTFWIDADKHSHARLACIALGIYLFGVSYSPGVGPVPFTYSAEAYPLYVRAYGMSLATATNWFFNALLSITWPSMQTAFKPQGAFSWYATWNIIGFFLILILVPETKGKTLEELDYVFSVPTAEHAAFGLRQLRYFAKRYVLRQKEVRLERDPDRGFDDDDEKGM
ncbi:MAG: hypothetical protein Q9173_000208 [Seirophora scorigena]